MVNKRFLEFAERHRSPEAPKPKEETHTPESKLTQILKRDRNGKPILQLTPIEKTAVNIPTQEDYWDLMRTYELGEWRWWGGELLTQKNFWIDNKEQTCIGAGVNHPSGVYDEGKFKYSNRKTYLKEDWEIISPQEFYQRQNITPEILREINEWFDENA